MPKDFASLPVQHTRAGFGEGLLAAGQKDENVMALCADLTESIKVDAFAKQFPDRFVETGVAEQNLMGIAAGLALSGKVPFAASYAAFNPGRNYDQLRVSVVYSQANVKVVGSHGGLTVGPDGATHQMLEDIAMTRVLPGLTVVVPCDYIEAKKATLAVAKHVGPVYLRLMREAVPTVTEEDTPFELGKAVVLRKGTDVTICATGIMVSRALQAAEELAKKKISCEVLNIHTIKPLDEHAILASAKKTGCVVTAEEAQAAGGLGGAVAELLGEKLPLPLHLVGVRDSFGESGTAEELLEKFGLTSGGVTNAVHSVIKRKQC